MKMHSKLLCIVVFATLATLTAGTCKNPEVSVNPFATQDATIVSQIGYIAEFELTCSGAEEPSLFAEIDGKVLPVARTGPSSYQISLNEEVKKARSGSVNIRLFDEEGFAEIRKAQRSGDDLSSVQALTEFVLNTPSTYKGPWVNSELVAAGAAAFVAYFAFSAKGKILS